MNLKEYDKMFELEDRHWWFVAKRLFIKTLLPSQTKNWLILDLGAGTGGTSAYLRNWGNVVCVESSSQAVKWLKKRGLKLHHCPIESLKHQPAAYDLVCLFDVLYHRNIKSDQKVLEVAHSALKKNGLLLVTDCALPWLESHHDQIMHARERYFLGDLCQKINLAGFRIEKKSYAYFFLFPIFLTSRLVNKIIPFSTTGGVNPIINSLFLNICKIEAFLLKHLSFPIGSSLLIKARKA